MPLKIAIGGDHAGFEFKAKLIDWLKAENYEVKDFGTYSTESVDYPDYVHPLSKAVAEEEFDRGILICGSGNGVCMTANKHQGIRAAMAWADELALLARTHNNANILCLPARFVAYDDAKKMAKTFLTTEFEGGRHQRRVDKINP
jgi:ribose 5-phosphate isomerase B